MCTGIIYFLQIILGLTFNQYSPNICLFNLLMEKGREKERCRERKRERGRERERKRGREGKKYREKKR